MKATLSTKGFADFLELIAEMGEDVNEAAVEALNAGADVIQAGMKKRAPKRTHRLENAIDKSDVMVEGNEITIEIGLLHGGDKEANRYGPVNEFGKANMAAQPFVRPTMKEDGNKANQAMKAVFVERGIL